MLRRLKTRWPEGLVALLAFAARLVPTPRTIDDAFITFRYARHLLAGAGFVFNAGERVLGTTTPLYTLLMAALSALTAGQNYPWLALLVNALADALTCLLLIRLGERFTGRAAGLAAALLWAVSPMSVTFAVGGMETSVFILWLTLTADLYLAGRTRAAALTSALLLLTRPDGALFVGPLILDLLWRRWRETSSSKKLPLAEAGIFLLALAPWAIFAALYFGSPIPHAVTAKALAYRLPPGASLVRLIQHYGTPFFEHNVFGNVWPLIGFILYLLIALVGGLAVIRRDARAWPMALYPWLYFAAFSAPNPLIFRWYLAPPLPFYFLLILAGIAKMAHDIRLPTTNRRPPTVAPHVPRLTPHAPRPTLHPSFILLPSSFFLVLSLTEWRLHPDHGPAAPAPNMAWHKLELLYAEVGRELEPRLTPETRVAAGDVGALGYYADARILDTVGLMSPEAVAYYPLDPALYVVSYAVAPQLILDQQPDYVVLLEVYGREGLFKDPRFLSRYDLIRKIPTDIYGSDGMLIWARRATVHAP
jgi:4-amino-4-deoxy-L-arabinose transferase-like glycosyltransferase